MNILSVSCGTARDTTNAEKRNFEEVSATIYKVTVTGDSLDFEMIERIGTHYRCLPFFKWEAIETFYTYKNCLVINLPEEAHVFYFDEDRE